MKGTRIALPLAFLAAAAAARAEFFHSPMVRLGSELDLFFTAKARAEYDDNLFLGRPGTLPESGAYYDLIPGIELEYGKDLPLTGSFAISRRYRTFFDSKLRNLDDEQDAYQFKGSFEMGGPLRVEAAATYAETARNTPEESALAGGGTIDGTLLRQTVYAQSVKALYQFTEKTSGGLGVRHSSNRYDPIARATPPPDFNTFGLREYDSWAIPVDARYKLTEKLSVGLALEYGESELHEARPLSAYLDTIERELANLTFNWMVTDKLDSELRVGVIRSTYQNTGFSNTSPSFSLRLSHSTTEKINQGLIIAQDATAAPNGGLGDSFQVGYDFNYNNSDAFRTFFRATYSESNVLSGNVLSAAGSAVNRIDVKSANAALGVSYAPDTHWVFSADYSYTTNIEPGDYDVNRVSLEAAFRW